MMIDGYKDNISKGEQECINGILDSNINVKFMAFKISIIYLIIGYFYIFFLDKVLYLFVNDYRLIRILENVKGYLYILVTSVLLLYLVKRYLNRSKYLIKKLVESYNVLEAANEELIATEEELRIQYDELQKNEETIRESKERYRIALESSNDIIWEWDIVNNEFYVSDKWYDMTGFKISKFKKFDRAFRCLVIEEDRDKALREVEEHLSFNTPYYRSEFRIKIRGKKCKWILCRGKAILDDFGKPVKMYGSMTDIDIRKEQEERINNLAYKDFLTGLPNRMSFFLTLKEITEKSKVNGALMFIDLDNFKNVNDTLGHNYGDELIKKIGYILKECILGKGNVYRIGGDEFAVICNSFYSIDDLQNLCIFILKMLNSPINIDNKVIHTSASIGITLFPEDGTDSNVLLKNADAAMYKSKSDGKNKYKFFDSSISKDILRRATIEKELRTAIKNKELEIFYQPQISLKNNKIIGFEALLRWNSKELGSVSPAEFIPIAEETGLIVSIGDWVIKNVFLQNREWKEKGYRYNTIAINVSAIQLKQSDFIQKLKKNIIEYNCLNSWVDIEITEGTLIKPFENNVKILSELKSGGINISLDDFGTGYSSLNYLKNLPISVLKIDKTFIDDISYDAYSRDIVDGIIQLAHKINLEVIAEGVETEEQMSILREIGCNGVQGYYFSKPLKQSLAEEMLKKELYN